VSTSPKSSGTAKPGRFSVPEVLSTVATIRARQRVSHQFAGQPLSASELAAVVEDVELDVEPAVVDDAVGSEVPVAESVPPLGATSVAGSPQARVSADARRELSRSPGT
jgi:hypothetical protein